MTVPLFERARRAADAIRREITLRPEFGIVLGSGLGGLADRVMDANALRYDEIPEFPPPGVPGHAGRLVIGRLGGRPVAALQGRFHYYEGHDLSTVTLPIRVLAALGVRTLILTAATGGVAPGLSVGQVTCLRDHINLLGANPLRGPHDERLGPRFPDMTMVYDARLRAAAVRHSDALGEPLREVVYAAMPGPSYETPAEIAMLRTLGADLVGMSTVPEAIVARQCGLRVLAFALVTNAAAGLGEGEISHEEVLAAGRGEGARRLGDLIERLLADPSV
jgi:purine-nucleoside phosphorylase